MVQYLSSIDRSSDNNLVEEEMNLLELSDEMSQIKRQKLNDNLKKRKTKISNPLI